MSCKIASTQHNWIRTEPKGKRGQRRKKETIDKESQRWLDTLTAAEVGVKSQVKLIHIGDREADIFGLYGSSCGGSLNLKIALNSHQLYIKQLLGLPG
jgi:hypothetical protein